MIAARRKETTKFNPLCYTFIVPKAANVTQYKHSDRVGCIQRAAEVWNRPKSLTRLADVIFHLRGRQSHLPTYCKPFFFLQASILRKSVALSFFLSEWKPSGHLQDPHTTSACAPSFKSAGLLRTAHYTASALHCALISAGASMLNSTLPWRPVGLETAPLGTRLWRY